MTSNGIIRISQIKGRKKYQEIKKKRTFSFTLDQIVAKPATIIDNATEIGSSIEEINRFGSNHRMKRAAVADKRLLWQFGIVPYVIDPCAGYSASERDGIVQAMQHWEKYTCITFIPRDPDEHDDYIVFTSRGQHQDNNCWSYVGRQGSGGQRLSIGDECHDQGAIIHEIGHALGFHHEHQRPDRDDYVDILTENIIDDPDSKNDLIDKYSTNDVNSLGEPYDYESIMHYEQHAYSISDKITIKTKDVLKDIGQQKGLSYGDVMQTNKLYQCPQCGQTFIGRQQASFTSENFESKPTSNQSFQCQWHIVAALGERIRLNITDFEIYASIDCQSDFLDIHEGYWHKSPLLGRFCGSNTTTPSVIMSTGNRMFINFISNHAEFRGFAATYETVCGGDLTDVNGQEIQSPNYLHNLLQPAECIWRINVPLNRRIRIMFSYDGLDLRGTHESCKNSYHCIQIHDGTNGTFPLIEVDNEHWPKTFISTTNQMYIRFISFVGLDKHSGFSATLFQHIDECVTVDHGCQQNCIQSMVGATCACYLGYKLQPDKKTCKLECEERYYLVLGF
ncbi:dorsal-ventral patterning tolloid-like protein 1 [Contarinia nasturtii]|uniref:dorsal-ventral patterning tolloid-like protein 1 n=1 Tax=Contarinia nasturtii TaxID=265458 RepID=UPI0012D3D595|nr:dorsal-ventral patterning tolloid-like protein 1 [Contarinia nasturtii]